MNRAILIWAASCGLVLATACKTTSEEPAKAKPGKLIVLFVKVVEESADKRQSQVLSEPMFLVDLGEGTGFFVGTQIPLGDPPYLEVSHRFDIKPTKISGQTIWIVIESTSTDYVKNERGELKPLEKRQVTKRKLELGKEVVEGPWKWNHVPKSQLHIEYRIERMTWKEYRLADAKAREASQIK
jgi:hypothetical protein